MFSTIQSAAIHGIEAIVVHVEVDTAQGLPGFMMVGYLSCQVKEAGERVRVALRNSGISIPPSHITVNLSPADIRKEGTAFDLPVAVGILKSLGHIPQESTEGTMIVGELSLDGAVNQIRGILPLVKKAREEGFRKCIVPEKNRAEGAVIPGIEIVGAATLRQVLQYLQKKDNVMEVSQDKDGGTDTAGQDGLSLTGQDGQSPTGQPDFSELSGQASARRCAEIAAAGFHHLLLIGPPGSGKTMLAKRIPTILPPLTREESLEVSSVYSVAGLLNEGQSMITSRPFLSPHHTITEQALSGGGRIPRPGVISLAHRGVLFLDEMPEFRQNILDMLRQPLEDREIHLSRLGGNFTYPADFMLVGALNPCPCGFYPDRNRCRCTPSMIRKYQSRISGPILDRMDLCAEVPRISVEELRNIKKNESSESIRKRVMAARRMQEERYAKESFRFNAALAPKDTQRYCTLGSGEQRLMEQAYRRLSLSARGYFRILKIARTIADLDGSESIRELHLSEAASCRAIGAGYWDRQ